VSLFAVRYAGDLDSGFVLAPERYDPRRHPLAGGHTQEETKLSRLAIIIRETVVPEKADRDSSYVILDTGDAFEGSIRSIKDPVPSSSIGSAKKVVKSGDIIISRLRPYLRQVALVDRELPEAWSTPNTVILVSTEFYVLRAPEDKSIAFLVPFFLSKSVQNILAASQEGGHHPRFPEKTLLNLCVPNSILAMRSQLSLVVENAVYAARKARMDLLKAAELAQGLLKDDHRATGAANFGTMA
jgi:hypothetical protein